ncbi:MAG TPA: TonB-dependent receptor [Oceanospirillales bacterium]|nr:TonB-dependent receptor [Oceanospirillales bacterium]
MKTKFNKRTALFLSMFAPLTMGFSSQTFAQDGAEEDVEEVVVLGSRRAARSANDSAVPVDVISGDDFVNQGGTDLSTLLRNVVPSYNVNTQPISDAATLVRPANLRGLAPDHTLVLVNGKRRHRAAVITWLGNGVADGSQGPDISQLPAIALKQVAVLRDGAAAQYGSDAIAGVMNFTLKDASEGATFEARYGEFFAGDGQTYSIAGNVGLPFTDSGFVNLSFEYGNTDPTSRSVQRDDAAALIAAGNTAVANPAQIWGQPDISDDIKFVYNMGVQLDDDKEFYAFGNYGDKDVDGGFFFRNPNTRGGVFSNDGGATLLVGDVLDAQDGILDGSAGCPIVNITNNVPDPVALGQIMADPNCFVFNELFPGGFTPRFGGTVNDFSTVVGLKGELDNGWAWDISGTYGRSDVDFVIRNTVNASLGPQTPTKFRPGSYTQQDKNFNFDVDKGFAVGNFASDLNVAAGFEWRQESFEITAGDAASFQIGPYAAQGFSSASNGFPGFSTLTAGKFTRSNYAVYIDLEADVTDKLLIGFAERFEDFQDFGTTINGKLTARYEFTDNFALRSAYSEGFRAPTPGQSNAFNVSTQFQDGQLVNNGTIPSINPVAVVAGGKPLQAEESTNFTFGAVFNLGPVDVTIDYFRIDLDGRLTLSQNNELTDQQVADLIASGVTSAANLRNFRFFTNGFDTKTTGIDIVATYSTEIGNGNTDFVFSFNNTQTDVVGFDAGVLNARRIKELEEGLPETRWNVSANHTTGNWRFLTRLSYYDDFFDTGDNESYGDEYIVDAEIAYTFNENYTITLGAQNLLDEDPDESRVAGDIGNQFPQSAPGGFGGGFYYLRFRYEL